MTERIGIIVGWEDSFPHAFIDKVNQTPGFRAEFAKLGGIRESDPLPYRVLIDRISHEVPYYRIALKHASLTGSFVINDPLWWNADDKFFGFSLAPKLGVKVPRTVVLPQRSYISAIDPKRSLRNLEYPLNWEGICDYVKFPAVLKPAEGGGWKNVSIVHNIDELLTAYNASEQLVMTLQEFVDFTEYVRCICIGKSYILPTKWDPKKRDYIPAEHFLPKALENEVLDGAWAINNALGYDMNSVEFAICDGVPYAIDFTNPAPDMDVWSLHQFYFDKVVDAMAAFAIQAAREGRTNHRGYAFREWFEDPKPRLVGACGEPIDSAATAASVP